MSITHHIVSKIIILKSPTVVVFSATATIDNVRLKTV